MAGRDEDVYDDFGRVTSSTDPLGYMTTTACTTLDPARGLTLTSTDQNGIATTHAPM